MKQCLLKFGVGAGEEACRWADFLSATNVTEGLLEVGRTRWVVNC